MLDIYKRKTLPIHDGNKNDTEITKWKLVLDKEELEFYSHLLKKIICFISRKTS